MAERGYQRVKPACTLLRLPGHVANFSGHWEALEQLLACDLLVKELVRQQPWHCAASAHLGPRCRPRRKLPVERGRGMIDGLFCLGPPPGLLSWRMRLEDRRGHKTMGGGEYNRDKARSG